jgi:hypothetical protein
LTLQFMLKRANLCSYHGFREDSTWTSGNSGV